MIRTLFAGSLAAIRLAVPLILAQMAVVLLGMVDTITFGQLGTEALAGGALGNATFWIVNIFCIGVLAAVANLVAYAAGAGDEDGIRHAVRAGLIVAVVLGLVTGLLVSLAPHLLVRMGQKPQTVDYAGFFLLTVAWAILPNLVYIALRGLAIGLSRPGPIAVITAAALALKVGLNAAIYYYVRQLPVEEQAAFGLMACGAANVLVNAFMALALFMWLRRHLAVYLHRLWQGPWRAGIDELWRLGLPMGVTFGVESSLFSGAAFIVGQAGEVALAAHQIALQFGSLTFMLAAGLSHSSSARVGHAAGAGDMREARRLGWQAIWLGLIIISAPAVIFVAFGHELAGWLVADGAQNRMAVVMLAAQFLLVAAAFQWADSTQSIAMGALRGLKYSGTTMVVCTIGYCVIGLPLVYVLQRFWGSIGAWIGLLVSLYVTALMLVERFDTLTKPARTAA